MTDKPDLPTIIAEIEEALASGRLSMSADGTLTVAEANGPFTKWRKVGSLPDLLSALTASEARAKAAEDEGVVERVKAAMKKERDEMQAIYGSDFRMFDLMGVYATAALRTLSGKE